MCRVLGRRGFFDGCVIYLNLDCLRFGLLHRGLQDYEAMDLACNMVVGTRARHLRCARWAATAGERWMGLGYGGPGLMLEV